MGSGPARSPVLGRAMQQVLPFVLCGGAGTRLWPLSREAYPKQFHRLTGPESLFQLTCRRLSGPLFGELSASPSAVSLSDRRAVGGDRHESRLDRSRAVRPEHRARIMHRRADRRADRSRRARAARPLGPHDPRRGGFREDRRERPRRRGSGRVSPSGSSPTARIRATDISKPRRATARP